MRRSLPIIGLLVGALLAPSAAFAEGGDLTLGLQGGAAVPLSSPQLNRFDAGGAAAVRPSVDLTSFLDLGVVGSVIALPSTVKGVDTGTAWGLGGGLRLKRPRDAKNTDRGLAAVSPWLEADGQYVRTGPLDRGAVSIGAGLAFPVTDSRVLWTGPVVQYTEIVQPNKPGFDNTDGHMVIVGWNLEFGPPAKKAEKKCVQSCSDRDHDGVVDSADKCPDVPGPVTNSGCPLPPPKQAALPPPAPQPVHVRVQFALDSAKLSKAAEAQLAKALESTKGGPERKVEVRGYASSEGPLKHNQALAQQRANAVAAWLQAHGVKADRVTAKGFGVTAPVGDNRTQAGREANRRADVDVAFIVEAGAK